MRIIAESGRSGIRRFVIEAGEREVLNLCGFPGPYRNGAPHLAPGDEINVSAIFDKVHALKENKQIPMAVRSLRELANLLELQEPMISSVTTTEEEDH